MFSNGEKVRLFSDDKALQGSVKQIGIGKETRIATIYSLQWRNTDY